MNKLIPFPGNALIKNQTHTHTQKKRWPYQKMDWLTNCRKIPTGTGDGCHMTAKMCTSASALPVHWRVRPVPLARPPVSWWPGSCHRPSHQRSPVGCCQTQTAGDSETQQHHSIWKGMQLKHLCFNLSVDWLITFIECYSLLSSGLTALWSTEAERFTKLTSNPWRQCQSLAMTQDLQHWVGQDSWKHRLSWGQKGWE